MYRTLRKKVIKDYNKHDFDYYSLYVQIKKEDFIKVYGWYKVYYGEHNEYHDFRTSFGMYYEKVHYIWEKNGYIMINICEKPRYGKKMIKEFIKRMKEKNLSFKVIKRKKWNKHKD